MDLHVFLVTTIKFKISGVCLYEDEHLILTSRNLFLNFIAALGDEWTVLLVWNQKVWVLISPLPDGRIGQVT